MVPLLTSESQSRISIDSDEHSYHLLFQKFHFIEIIFHHFLMASENSISPIPKSAPKTLPKKQHPSGSIKNHQPPVFFWLLDIFPFPHTLAMSRVSQAEPAKCTAWPTPNLGVTGFSTIQTVVGNGISAIFTVVYDMYELFKYSKIVFVPKKKYLYLRPGMVFVCFWYPHVEACNL